MLLKLQMLQNSCPSWRARVRAKSAIVAIHLLSVISSIRMYVSRASRRGVECTCTPISSGCMESVVYIYGLLLLGNVRSHFYSLLLPTFWRQLAKIARGATRARCRFADFLLCFVIAALRPSTEAAAAPFNPSYLGRQTDGPVNPFVTGIHCWACLLHVQVFLDALEAQGPACKDGQMIRVNCVYVSLPSLLQRSYYVLCV